MSGVSESLGFLFSDDAYWSHVDDDSLRDLIWDVTHMSDTQYSGDLLIRLFENERDRLQVEKVRAAFDKVAAATENAKRVMTTLKALDEEDKCTT